MIELNLNWKSPCKILIPRMILVPAYLTLEKLFGVLCIQGLATISVFTLQIANKSGTADPI